VNDVFISYAAPDRSVAEALAVIFKKLGWQVWLDRDISPGESWNQSIENALHQTRSVVCLWSTSALKSSWVQNEARFASKRSILVPVLIEQVSLPLEFEHLQASNLTTWDGNTEHPALSSLIEPIEHLRTSPPNQRDASPEVVLSAASPPSSASYNYSSIESGLGNPFPSARYLQDLAILYEATTDPSLRGITGFQLFVVSADSKSPSAENTVTARFLKVPDHYLADEAVVSELFRYSRVPAEWQNRLTGLTFHKAGTTSFILQSDERYALKVIEPRFQNVTTVTLCTARYKADVQEVSHTVAPKVYMSDERFVIMRFIPGVTLSEFCAQHLARGSRGMAGRSDSKYSLGEEQLNHIGRLFGSICDALHDCASKNPSVHHLDLSPDNIIVGPNNEIHLIDFGVNYLLKEHVGSVGGLSRAQHFIAPELQRGIVNHPELADAYSLGMILLEMLVQQPLTKDQLTTDLDDIWIAYQDLAAIIEDLIDEHRPGYRLVGRPRGPSVFQLLRAEVDRAINVSTVIAIVTREDQSPVSHVIETLFNSIVPQASVKELKARWDRIRDAIPDDGGIHLRRLFRESVAVQSVHLGVVTAFCWLVIFFPSVRICDHLHACISDPSVPLLPAHLDGALNGRLNGLLPGRLVALSFSMTLARYYANIFATVTFQQIRLKEIRIQLKIVEGFVRWHPITCFLPISYALIVDPKAWAFCSAIGLIGVCVNNLLTLRVAKDTDLLIRSYERHNSDLPFTRASMFVRERLADFEAWWLMILVYIICLSGLGTLILQGFARDEWLYAVFVSVFVNILMMLRHNCLKLAPGVRTLLRRIVWRLRRLETILDASSSRTSGDFVIADGARRPGADPKTA